MKKSTAKKRKCPTCGSSLTEEQYSKALGVWKEKQNELDDAKRRAKAIEKKATEQLQKAQEELKKADEKMKNVKKNAEISAKLKYEKKQKEFEKMKTKEFEEQTNKIVNRKLVERTQKYQNQMKKQDESIKKLQNQNKKLQEQLKKGSTPQIEGFNFEEQIYNKLKKIYPSDNIVRTGKEGDIFHIIIVNGVEIGSILYELKKTEKFSSSYIEQIRNDKISKNATYGILITFSDQKNKAGFRKDRDIIIIHPDGVIELVSFLRATIVELYKTRKAGEDVTRKAKLLNEYLESDEYKNNITSIINQCYELRDNLKKEMHNHMKDWQVRWNNITDIHNKTRYNSMKIEYITTHGALPDKVIEYRQLPSLEIPKEEKKEVE